MSGSPKPLMEETKEGIDTIMGTALYGPIFLLQKVVPKMPRGGRIISTYYILSAWFGCYREGSCSGGCQSRPFLIITDYLYCLDIGSIASKMGMPMSPLYAAAKAAMDTLSYAASMQVRFGLLNSA